MNLITAVVAAIAVLAVGWLLLLGFLWLHRPSRELVGPALRLIPDLIRLVRALLADRSTPPRVRVALVGLIAYLLSPLDLIPDMVPVLGAAVVSVEAGAVVSVLGAAVVAVVSVLGAAVVVVVPPHPASTGMTISASTISAIERT